MNTEILLKGEDIRKSFALEGRTLDVLRGVDLEMRSGDFISVVGASGSGKSTLLHILGGLEQPSGGRVLWTGRDIAALRDEELARSRGSQVGFVFQFHHLLGEFTACENVMLPMMIAGVGRKEAEARSRALLLRVDLEARGTHRPSELSGGEQQRVAVARALANNPAVLLADEPTGNLDSENGAHLIELLVELNRDAGQALLVVTHDEQLARRAALRFHMADGRLERL
jgi:ABC-type lipoprotein export system ATPase subunit